MQYSEIMAYLTLLFETPDTLLPRKDQCPPQNGKGFLHINKINELKQKT